ncbi:Scr1 family TA system antitoxin-like transcriptional regulator [Nocardia sp. NPDC004278]
MESPNLATSEVERRVELSVKRQSRLTAFSNPLTMTVLLDESALRRLIGRSSPQIRRSTFRAGAVSWTHRVRYRPDRSSELRPAPTFHRHRLPRVQRVQDHRVHTRVVRQAAVPDQVVRALVLDNDVGDARLVYGRGGRRGHH